MSTPVRILAYLRHYPPPMDGGAYFMNFHLFDALRQHGFSITILSHSKVEAIDDADFSVIPVDSIKTGRHNYASAFAKGLDLWRSAIELRKEQSRKKYDYIFSDAGYLQNLVVFLGTLGTRTKIIGINLTEEISIIQKETRLRALLQRWLLGRHYCNIVISNHVRKLMLSIGINAPAVLLYPSFLLSNRSSRNKDSDRALLVKKYNVSSTGLLIGFLGRHIERKGLTNLLFAVKQLIDDEKDICLLIAGEGPKSQVVRDAIEQTNYRHKLKMIGVIEEKDMFFSGIDVFAMPNYENPLTGDTEGFGIVFLEAAQQGTPVVGGKDGGVPEAISDGYNGFIVDGQSIPSIKEAIEKYYYDPSLRATHGENGKVWAQSFNWQTQVQPLLHFLANR